MELIGDEAIEKMKEAISQYIIVGCETTLSFGKYVMDHEAFVSGDFDTNFVKNHYDPTAITEERESYRDIAAQLASQLYEEFLAGSKQTSFTNTDSLSWRKR